MGKRARPNAASNAEDDADAQYNPADIVVALAEASAPAQEVAQHQQPIPESVASIDLASTSPEEEERWKQCRWVWCNTCAGGTINKTGWKHKTEAGHDVVSLKKADKLDEAKKEFIFISRGGKHARQVVAAHKQADEAGKSGQHVVSQNEYKLDFGKYKGRTLPDMFDSEHDQLRDYIPWLFVSVGSKRPLSPMRPT